MDLRTALPPIPVVVQNLHFKGFGSLGHFVADGAHSHNPQGGSRNLSPQPVSGEILCVGGDRNLITLEEGKEGNTSRKGCPAIWLLFSPLFIIRQGRSTGAVTSRYCVSGQ